MVTLRTFVKLELDVTRWAHPLPAPALGWRIAAAGTGSEEGVLRLSSMSQKVFTLLPILLFTPSPSLLFPGRGNSGCRNATRTCLSVWQPFSNRARGDPQAAPHRPMQSLSSARSVRRKDGRRWAGGRTPNDGWKASTSVLFTREMLVSVERMWAPDVLFTRS